MSRTSSTESAAAEEPLPAFVRYEATIPEGHRWQYEPAPGGGFQLTYTDPDKVLRLHARAGLGVAGYAGNLDERVPDVVPHLAIVDGVVRVVDAEGAVRMKGLGTQSRPMTEGELCADLLRGWGFRSA